MISSSQRQLRALLMVADELHVGRAAERLGVTQPSLSRQIAAMEKDLGVPLFSRARRRFVLTPAGEVVVAGAREILARSDEVVRDAKRAHAGEVGSLRLGFVQSATYDAIPRLVSTFRAAYPDVVVNARTMTTLEQSVALRSGHLDVGLLRPVMALHGLTKKVISRDALVAALPATHRLVGYERIPLAALADESFVFFIRDSGPIVHDTIIGYCLAAGFSPRIVQEAQVQTIPALVAADLGVSLLISPTPPHDASQVVYRPIQDDLPLWDMALAWSASNQSPTLARFLAVAENASSMATGDASR
ncbi:LysR substrate-binding domain-containing protein [Actinopolymorpha sp. B17G11]|uniref:LysR family transcriptional regulator n=1 Tax=unclassified Actinopolymorpha TaxID=2627063 RepID=UPI0032D92137